MAGTQTRRAPYKDTLQPALHRRFSSTASLLLAVSYIESILLSTWDSYFWSWFPLGPAGFRTLLLFTCGLTILVLRIASYHVGIKTTGSGLQTFASSLLSPRTYETAFWYSASSLLYCAIYLGTTDEDTNLQWITYFSGDRARLNERPVFLACYMFTFALIQTVEHYRHDIDRLDLGALERKPATEQKNTGIILGSLQAVLEELPMAIAESFKLALAAIPATVILYFFFLRSFAWSWTLTFLRPFYNLPKTNMLPSSWPSDIYLLARCVLAGAGVGFLWAAGNRAFSLFMVKKPLKNGNPLTSESKDPNGSLLNGLKSKKLSIKSFAMWELALTAQNHGTRRQSIFNDIDRTGGPVWSQIYSICMETLKTIETHVDAYGQPAAHAAPDTAQIEEKQRSSAPLRQDAIFTSQSRQASLRSGVEKALDKLARKPGSTPASELSPIARKTWKSAKDRVLSKEQQEAVSPDHLMDQAKQIVTRLISIGWISDLIRQNFRTQFAAAVLGSPYAEPTLHANAATALCQLAVHSLAEDSYGNVHRDVPSIIRTLASIIKKIEGLKAQFPLHWTDIRGLKECPEVDELLEALKTGLEQVISKFEPYSTDLRLTRTDLRIAKEAIGKPEVHKTKVAEVAPKVQEPSLQTRTSEDWTQKKPAKVEFKRKGGDESVETWAWARVAMAQHRLFLRVLYRSLYLFLYVVLCGLLLITPGDAIQRSVVNKQWYNIWIIASGYVVTVFIVGFVYIVRLYVNRTVLASIPKSWVPVDKGDVKEAIYKMVAAGLSRSSAIAYAARPRVDEEMMGDDQDEDDDQDEARTRARLTSWNEQALGRDEPTPMPPHRPVWGTIEHCGWASPNSPDLANLQYGSVIAEIPNLIEAQALRLAPSDPTSQADPPMLDPEAAELLQRLPSMSLRDYFGHLTSLGVAVMDEAVADFLSKYEEARFSTKPVCNARFRELMHLFAEILRSIQPLDPVVLDHLYEDEDEEEREGMDMNRRGTVDSDIDNDAPAETIPSTPRTISRPSTASTQRSVQRRTRRRTNTYRTAPSTPGSRRNMDMSPRNAGANGFAQMRRTYTSSQHSSAASLRSKSSDGSGSVIRLADSGDASDLPYILSLTESTATRY
ncbi:nucleoporin protein Ndc1-Nup domain-containing protein [Trichoderma chlorosporum]